MSAIFTTVHWDGRPVEKEVLDAANSCMRYRCPDGTDSWLSNNIGMAQADLATLPEDQPGVLFTRWGLHIAADCRIDNRHVICQLLPNMGLDKTLPDAAYILAAYRAWGSQCVDRLIGDFAFVIWDEVSEHIFAARDISGVRPLFYYREHNRLLLASDRTQIFQDPTVPFEVDEDQIIEFLTPTFQFTSGWDQGLFKGVYVLKPGWILDAHNNEFTTRRYWSVRDSAIDNRSEQQVIDEYLHTLNEAVRCRLRSRNNKIAMELSGGLDSTAIACLAARMASDTGTDLRTLSMVFDNFPEIDERPRIRSVLDRYPALLPHFLAADHMHVPNLLDTNYLPNNISGIYELAALPIGRNLHSIALGQGSNVLISGDMGDSLNNGSHRLHYDLMRRGQLVQVCQQIHDDYRRISPRGALGGLVFYGLLPLLPEPLRRLGLIWLDWYEGSYCELPAYTSDTFQHKIMATDQAIRQQRATEVNMRCPASRLTLLNMLHPMIPCTVPLSYPIELRVPYHDRRLVEMVLGMPQSLKWERYAPLGQNPARLHHRKALAGILPDEVRLRNPRVNFAPVIDQSLTADTIRSWLINAPIIHISERGYIDLEHFIRLLTDPTNIRFYLTPLLCVEAWLRAIGSNGAFRNLIPSRRTALLNHTSISV